MGRGPPEEPSPALQPLLDALDDPDCRTILRALDRPMTTQELMDACDLSQTTAYRKLDRLDEAGLVEGRIDVRDDGHHTTRYDRAFAGVVIGLTDDDLFEVTVIRESETAADRLAQFWTEVSEEL